MKPMDTKPQIIAVMSIEEAIAGDNCPHCGQADRRVYEHIRTCSEAHKNIDLDKNTDRNCRWATHDLCGKVLVLRRQDGLCLVENDHSRYVVPISSLHFGMLSRLIDEIEEYDLATEEIEKLINILRIKGKGKIKIPPHPELWPGCRLEVQMGQATKIASIKVKRGACYLCETEDGVSVLISPKNILGIK